MTGNYYQNNRLTNGKTKLTGFMQPKLVDSHLRKSCSETFVAKVFDAKVVTVVMGTIVTPNHTKDRNNVLEISYRRFSAVLAR